MKNTYRFIFSTLLFFIFFAPVQGYATGRVTILKDGGGADLIENSLVGVTLAVYEGADYLELPVNLTSDDQLVIFRDTTLNRLTDVADLFSERNREDGSYYVVDFTLSELRQLRLSNVFEDGNRTLSFAIPTLEETLTLVRTLNRRFQKNTGVVISLIQPAFYTKEGKNMGSQLKNSLERLSYGAQDKLYIESADPDELQRISHWQLGENGNRFALIQRIELEPATDPDPLDTTNRRIQHSWLFTNSGLRILASYANTVTLPQEVITESNVDIKSFIQSFHNYDIKVFTNTPSNSQRQLAEYDGVYLTSLNQPVLEESSITESSVQNDPLTEDDSTLPPFFSNLGLSKPKPNTNTNTHSNTNTSVYDSESNDKELE